MDLDDEDEELTQMTNRMDSNDDDMEIDDGEGKVYMSAMYHQGR